MTLLAIMTQPMRAPYCRAYLARADFTRAIVLVGERGVFTSDELPPRVEIRFVDNKTIYGSSLTRVWARARGRLAGLSHSGSGPGRLVGRVGRAAERLARRVRRASSPTTSPGKDARARPASYDPIAAELESIDRTHPITRIVVFDVFDLPSALEFASGRDIVVLVR